MVEAKVSSLMIAHISVLIRYVAKMILKLERLGYLSDIEAAHISSKIRSIYYTFHPIDMKVDGRKVTEDSVIVIRDDDDIEAYFLIKDIIVNGNFEKQIIKPMLIHVLDEKSEHNNIKLGESLKKDFENFRLKIMAAELTCSTLQKVK